MVKFEKRRFSVFVFLCLLNLFHVNVKHILRSQGAFLQLLCQFRQGKRQNRRTVCRWILEDKRQQTQSH